MKYIDGFDNEKPISSCPSGKEIVWNCMPSNPITTITRKSDGTLVAYTALGDIFDLPVRAKEMSTGVCTRLPTVQLESQT